MVIGKGNHCRMFSQVNIHCNSSKLSDVKIMKLNNSGIIYRKANVI